MTQVQVSGTCSVQKSGAALAETYKCQHTVLQGQRWLGKGILQSGLWATKGTSPMMDQTE